MSGSTAKLPCLDGWVPAHVSWAGGGPEVAWCHLGGERFTAPFYDQTIGKAMQSPFNLVFQHRTPMDVLVDWAVARPGIPPTGFIFHLSRCGSTLISRMLAALPQNVVISEAPPVNAVLRTDERGVSEEQRIAWLRAMMSALGQPRKGEETQFFVKFDNSHTLDLPLIQKAFPEVPWIFLHRDPVEVMVSHLANAAPHMLAGTMNVLVPGVDRMAALQMPTAEYCARMLGAICRTANEGLMAGGGMAVDYTELPDVVWTRVAEHFGIAWTEADVEKMREVVPYHAKNPSFYFEGDKESKQKSASDEVRSLCATFIEPHYAQLRQPT